MLIAKLTESDFFGGEPVYIEDDTRYNVRGVLTDGKGNIAMMKLDNSDYCKLPGGSIEITETQNQAFLRQIFEQTGYQSEIIGYLGWIEEHKAKRRFCMVSHCYAAKITSDECDKETLKSTQQRLGYKLVWLPFDEAVQKLSELQKVCKEYQMSFVLRREHLILDKARQLIEEAKK